MAAAYPEGKLPDPFRSRIGYLSQLTRQYNRIAEVLKGVKNIDEVIELTQSIRRAWVRYEVSHEELLLSQGPLMDKKKTEKLHKKHAEAEAQCRQYLEFLEAKATSEEARSSESSRRMRQASSPVTVLGRRSTEDHAAMRKERQQVIQGRQSPHGLDDSERLARAQQQIHDLEREIAEGERELLEQLTPVGGHQGHQPQPSSYPRSQRSINRDGTRPMAPRVQQTPGIGVSPELLGSIRRQWSQNPANAPQEGALQGHLLRPGQENIHRRPAKAHKTRATGASPGQNTALKRHVSLQEARGTSHRPDEEMQMTQNSYLQNPQTTQEQSNQEKCGVEREGPCMDSSDDAASTISDVSEATDFRRRLAKHGITSQVQDFLDKQESDRRQPMAYQGRPAQRDSLSKPATNVQCKSTCGQNEPSDVLPQAENLGYQLPVAQGYVPPPNASYGLYSTAAPSFQQGQTPTPAQAMDRLAQVLERQTMLLEGQDLPKAELLTFDGNPKNWIPFWANFKAHLGTGAVSYQKKLDYLTNHLEPHVRACVSTSQVQDPQIGYERAVRKLKRRYGSEHVISRAYIEDLIKGPKIGAQDVAGLDQFASDLDDCYVMLTELNYTNELNSGQTLEQCAERLPDHLLQKWNEKTAKMIVDERREPRFNDLVRWVEKKAEYLATKYSRSYCEKRQLAPVKKPAQTAKSQQSQRRQSTFTQKEEEPGPPAKSQGAKAKVKREQSAVATPVAARQTSSDGGSQPKPKACASCDTDSHELVDCWKFKKKTPQEKADTVLKARLCFRCLKPGHMAKYCRDKITCKNCGKRHHTMLHDESKSPSKATSSVNTTQASQGQTVVIAQAKASRNSAKRQSWLGVLPVVVHGKATDVITYAMIDSGSSVSLMSRELWTRLNLDGQPIQYDIQTINDVRNSGIQWQGDVVISDVEGKKEVNVPVRTIDHLPIKFKEQPEEIKKWSHLKHLTIAKCESGAIELLIGTDCPTMFWTEEERRGKPTEPMARRTPLGWIILGPVGAEPPKTSTKTMINPATIQLPVFLGFTMATRPKPDPLQHQLEKQWNADFGDLDGKEKDAMSLEDKKALKIMEDTVKTVKGKYQLAIPWRGNPEDLPNNRPTAESRLKMLKRRLLSDDHLKEQYVATVEKYIADGHARKMTASELGQDRAQWYLPHHPVFKRSNPEKCRVVFDCAAKYRGTSLNDVIMQGPNLLNNLAGVLIRFRKERVAVVADVEAMFHQCRVTPRDENFLRFLWWDKGDTDKPHKVYCMSVHLFGATSSPSVANFCMKKTAHDYKNYFSPTANETLLRSFYMDDMLKSVPTEEDAELLVVEMTALLKCGGFKLTKFMSTSREVLNMVAEEERAKSVRAIDLKDATLPEESALGLRWAVETDSFTYAVDIEEKPMTKRGLLSTTASLYDPLGFVGPVLLIPKLIQQELCRRQLEWDDAIPDDLLPGVVKWLEEIKALRDLRIPRCIKPTEATKDIRLELHCFSDASETAYGAAIYAKFTAGQDIIVNFIIGKSRVAPLKTLSIPRLELTAALIACKLHQFALEELDMEPDASYFWTDSQTVLRYLENNSTRYKVFVAHRICAIHELSKPEQWCYVPTKQNPADLASRGIQPNDDARLAFWLRGPEFLKSQNQDYRRMFVNPDDDDTELEEKVYVTAKTQLTPTQQLLAYYSDFHRLLKAVATYHQFVLYLQRKQPSSPLKVSDLATAEFALWKYCQAESFSEEVKMLTKQQAVKSSSPLATLDPFMGGDGLVRVGGRLSNTAADIEKNPVVLPNSYATDLLIEHIHRTNGHCGVNHTLSILRKTFYILRGYVTVKKVLTRCVRCRRLYAKPIGQKMSDLPEARTQVNEPPFTNTGVDYFGPVSVSYRRGTVKRWGCLFTCLVTRAVHIEVAHSLSADSFIMAFDRFVARRGKPARMFSDNGSNFVAADQELRDEIQKINDKKVDDHMLLQAVEWHFTPPHAPHMGGAWERLIKSVKATLRGLIGYRLLNDEELVTYLTQVEKVLNDRPLTRMGSDPRDATPIRPSDLLLLRPDSSQTTVDESNPLRKRWTVMQRLADSFWERFTGEYLPLLQQRSKWTQERQELRVNDIVLVMDTDVPRGQWPLGLIVEVIKSEDGRVRSARVKIGKTEWVRPATRLVFLEHHDTEDNSKDTSAKGRAMDG